MEERQRAESEVWGWRLGHGSAGRNRLPGTCFSQCTLLSQRVPTIAQDLPLHRSVEQNTRTLEVWTLDNRRPRVPAPHQHFNELNCQTIWARFPWWQKGRGLAGTPSRKYLFWNISNLQKSCPNDTVNTIGPGSSLTNCYGGYISAVSS